MKKLSKIVAAVIVAVVVLVAAAALAVPLLIDEQDVKDQLSARVKAATGRDLAIPGEVDLSVFPWLGATLGEVSLGNAEGFTAPVFASTEKVDVHVKLMPLFERRVEMDTVTVHGLVLNLERNAAGKANWEDLGAGAAGKKDGGAAGDAGSGGDGGRGLAGFAISGIDIRDGTVTYTDAAAGRSYRLADLTLATGELTPGRPVDMELGFDVASTSPPMQGRVSAAAKVDADADAQRVDLSGLTVTASMTGDTLPGGKLDASLAANVSVDGAKHTAAIRDLAVKVADLEATGAIDVTGLDASPAFAGDLAVAEFNPKSLIAALGRPAPETSDANALTRLALTAKLAGGADAVTLDPLQAKLDDSTLTGKLAVSDFAAPAVRFDLAVDAIDVDRYLPPGTEAPPASPGAAAGAAGGLPVDTLRGLNVAGTVKAGKVEVAKLDLSDVNATVDAKGGVIRLSPIGAKLYEGSYAGNITLDARKETPVVSLDEALNGVKIEPLLLDLQGKAPLTGTANVSAKLAAQGTTPDAMKRTVDGTVAFQFLDGAINGVNIGKMIRDARGVLQGGEVPGGEGAAQTDFAEITGTATVKDGLVSNQDLSAKSPLLRLSGKGTASLPEETLDYRATVTLVATSKGQGGKDRIDLAGVPIPLRITGTFTDPKYGLDTEGLAQALAETKAKELIDEQKEKLTGKVEEQAKEKLGESVGRILGGEGKGGADMLKGILGN